MNRLGMFVVAALAVLPLFMLAAPHPCSGYTPPDAEVRRLVAEGDRLCDRKQYEAARQAYEDAIARDPGFTDAYRKLHDLRLDRLKEPLDSILAEIDGHLAADPNSAMWHYLSGRQASDLGRRAALDREAVRLEPDHPWGHYGLAHTLMLEGDYDGAEAGFQRTLDVDPTHLYARTALAELLGFRQRRYAEALDQMEVVVRSSPDFQSGSAQSQLERLLHRLMPIDSVLSYYSSKIGSADSTSRRYATVGLANTLRGLGRYAESASAYREALNLAPRGRWWSRLRYYEAEMLYRAGDIPGAVASYDSVLVSQDSSAYYFSRAEVFRTNLGDSLRTGEAVVLDVPWEMQDGPTCASACDAMQLTFLGRSTTEKEVIRHVHNKWLGGGTTFNITQFPRRCGYISEDVAPTAAGYMINLFASVNREKLDEAKAFIDAGIPLQPFILYESDGHAVVLVGYDDRKGAVVIHNPQSLPARNIFEEIPYEEFNDMWKTAAYSYAVIVPQAKQRQVPRWSVSPVFSMYPIDGPNMLFGTTPAHRVISSSLHGGDLYATEHHLDIVTGGLSLDYFGNQQRLWVSADYRLRDGAWRYQAGFHNWSFPSAHVPALLSAYTEDGLWGWSVLFKPFSTLTLALEGDYVVEEVVEVLGLPWEEGTDIRIAVDYWYADLSGGMRHPRGWAAGTMLSGAKKFMGGDYDYAKGKIWAYRYFGLPWSSTLRFAQVFGWIRGATPVQSRFSTAWSAGLDPRRAARFRNVAGGARGERLLAATAEISRPLLSSTPLHSVIPLTGYLFYDVAYTWSAGVETGAIRFSDFGRTWGCGIHMEFLAVEAAFPADGRPYDRSEFYFSINWGDW